MIETASSSAATDPVDHRQKLPPIPGGDDDAVVSLVFSGSDGATTDSSDDSYTCRSRKGRQRRQQQQQRMQGGVGFVHNSKEKLKKIKQDSSIHSKNAKSKKEIDVEKYMAHREMTPFQERMNAITVMPGAFYCAMLLLSGAWLSQSALEDFRHRYAPDGIVASFDDSHCISWDWMPHLHAMPPLPVIAAATGIILHAPFSFIYHWRYAHRLPPGLARTTHWSRRMDQAMIHFCSACMSYATSGRFDFFFVSSLFNIDCFYRQFLTRVNPRQNQVRIGLSVFLYSIPILRRGEFLLYTKLGILFGISGWLFSGYPIGGWSHCVFHIVLAVIPPMLMTAALELPASQHQLSVAARCAMSANGSVVSVVVAS